MSSRALRKLNKQSLEDDLARYATTSQQDSSEDEAPRKPNKVNAFAFLNEEDEDDDDNEEPNGNDIDADLGVPKLGPVVKLEPVKLASKKSKKKKKGKKGKGKNQQQQEEKELDSDEELDKILRELEIKENRMITTDDVDAIEGYEESLDKDHVEMIDDSYQFFTIQKFNQCLKFLKVQPKDLDPDTEFKNLFGSELTSSTIEDGDSMASSLVSPKVLQQIKDMSKMVRGWGGKDRRSVPGSTRKLTFAKIRDDWIPTIQKSVLMDELTKNDIIALKSCKTSDWKDVISQDVTLEQKLGVRYYKFKPNVDSRIDNARFFISVVLTPDHESLILLLSKNPYHVETILQVSRVLFRQGDKSNSSSLVERALFVFDRALKQNFEIGSGLMRLPFEYFLNRQFYLSIFRYLELLTQRSTFYTALQYCIFMLSLNPTEDPYGVRYFIDFYAIMSGEYEYLIHFAESPLVVTYLDWITPALEYSKVLALLLSDFNKNLDKAKKSLKEAFEMYPYTGARLLEEVGLGANSYDNLFEDLTIRDLVVTESYMIRAKAMWGEDSKIRDFVNSELSQLLEQSKQSQSGRGVASFLSSFFGRKSKQEQEVPINLLRHVILSGESKVMAKLPNSFWDANKDKILEYDVLPPENELTESFADWVDDEMVTSALSHNGEDEALMEAIRESMRVEMERLQRDAAGE